jgi:hypothetical protein
MDIASAGIIILILLFPGFLFQKGYNSEEFSNKFIATSFFDLLIKSIVPSVFIHLLFWIIIINFGYDYSFKTILKLLSGNETMLKESINSIEQSKGAIVLFQVLINIFSFVMGLLLKEFVISYSLDSKYDLLRYENIWHYILTARFMDFKRSQIALFNDKIEDIDLTLIDAIQNINSESFLYSGFLVDYQLAKNGELDFLIIKNAQRKNISNQNEEVKTIKGHVVILYYKDLINLNITFFQTEQNPNNPDEIIFRQVE